MDRQLKREDLAGAIGAGEEERSYEDHDVNL
jgi:hypothetical protein